MGNLNQSFSNLCKTFPQEPHLRGKQFEILCRWYLCTDPHYSNSYKKVWLWDDWPGRWGPDCGIDLIAEDIDGKIHAIQAKCYSEDNSVTKKDIDSFLSESTDISKIHYRLLIATTNHIAKNARSVIERQNKSIPINLILLSDLTAAPISWPSSTKNLETGGLKPKYLPRPHQLAAIQDVVEKLDKRGQLIMACGTGKTLTALWISERLKAETILVVLPSLLLLSKTLSDWLVHSKDKFSYLPVCSDESVNKQNDSINFSTYELGYPSTTDPHLIREFLCKSGKKIIFSTYQSSQKIAEAVCGANLKLFDLMICDEAHRCAGKADSIYATVINDEMIPSKQRLFMTATPRIYKSHIVKKASETGVDILSMDDEKSFGKVLHNLSFSDAIKNNPPLLSDYQVVIIGVDHATYSEMIEERALVKTETNILSNAQTLASHIGLLRSIKNYNLNRVITFHSRVKFAKQFSQDLFDIIDWIPIKNRPPGDCTTNYVSGNMPTHQRAIKLQSLSDVVEPDTHVLSNARCLSEGVDVPALDGVAFIDPKNSEIDIIQAVGRAIRLSSNKVKGTIIIPVFVDPNEDVETNLQSSAFKKIWSIVNALRSHDDEFGQTLDEIRRGLGRKAPQTYKLEKIIFDFPTLITKDFEKALSSRIVETATASWEFWYGMLQHYKLAEGHANVPRNYKHGDFNLGDWISAQRKAYHNQGLTCERIVKLELLGVNLDPLESQFQEGIEALEGFKQVEGHANVPRSYKHGDFNLGEWISTQRKAYNKQGLTSERIEKLESLGIDWDPMQSQFQAGMKALEDFKRVEGHVNVPPSYKHGDFNLGAWVIAKRGKYNKKTLTPEHTEQLESLGIDWDPIETKFRKGLALLKGYKKAEGHIDVPKGYEYDGFRLGEWLSTQRYAYKNKTLKSERIEKLESLGIDWDPSETNFRDGIRVLKQYKKAEGHANVKHSCEYNGFRLGLWLKNQRNKYKNKTLAPKIVEQLESLGVDLDPLESQFKKGIKALEEFKQAEEHVNVPSSYKHGDFNLGAWVITKRMAYHKKILTPKRIEKLESLGIDWDPLESQFRKGIAALEKYKQVEGHVNVPIAYKHGEFNLGSWISNQRTAFKDKILTPVHIEQLESLGLDWDPMESRFREGMALLQSYKKAKGHVNVPRGHQERDFNLGGWVTNLRTAYRNQSLKSERIKQLEALGFKWTINDNEKNKKKKNKD